MLVVGDDMLLQHALVSGPRCWDARAGRQQTAERRQQAERRPQSTDSGVQTAECKAQSGGSARPAFGKPSSFAYEMQVVDHSNYVLERNDLSFSLGLSFSCFTPPLSIQSILILSPFSFHTFL